MRERYREGQIRHAGAFPKLVEQLAALRYDYDSTGKIAVESKAILRRRGLPSPDQADAVALAFAPMAPAPRGFRPRALGASRGVVRPMPGWD